jgi:RNA polymerase sigma-70 factor (ECF subfamily)
MFAYMGTMVLGVPVAELWFGAVGDEHGGGSRAMSRRVGPLAMPVRPLSADDAELVAQLQASDEAAFEHLFRRYFPRLVDFAAVTVLDRAVAEELAAEVFLSVWRRRESWAPQGSVASYLYRAVRNLAYNHVRDRNAEQERAKAAVAEQAALAPTGSLEGSDDREVRIAAVWAAVDQLPETRRAVVYLRWRANLSFEEIALLLETSPAAVKMQLSRALKTVRALLPTAFD